MDIIGTPAIRPSLFYSGKITGYGLWLAFVISFVRKLGSVRNTTPAITWISIALFSLGVLICIASISALGKSTRLGLPTEGGVLKTKGLYSVSRNPIYIGFHVMTTASLMGFRHWYLVFPGIYTFAVYHLIILGEERYLTQVHGTAYLDYREQVRRYL